jgi:transcriptional regulator with XRE-family HTH domain
MNLKELRKERGWTQFEFARKTRIHPSYLSLIESGKKPLRPKTARKIGRVLEMTIDDLLDRE